MDAPSDPVTFLPLFGDVRPDLFDDAGEVTADCMAGAGEVFDMLPGGRSVSTVNRMRYAEDDIPVGRIQRNGSCLDENVTVLRLWNGHFSDLGLAVLDRLDRLHLAWGHCAGLV